jgi:hypothetical protein
MGRGRIWFNPGIDGANGLFGTTGFGETPTAGEVGSSGVNAANGSRMVSVGASAPISDNGSGIASTAGRVEPFDPEAPPPAGLPGVDAAGFGALLDACVGGGTIIFEMK